jgi:hypothetical protein
MTDAIRRKLEPFFAAILFTAGFQAAIAAPDAGPMTNPAPMEPRGFIGTAWSEMASVPGRLPSCS